VLPEEVQLLQMINARRTSVLAERGGDVLVPSTTALLIGIAAAVEAAEAAGVIRPGPALARTVAWAAALGGALAADHPARSLPGIAREGQLGRQLNADLCAGSGAAAAQAGFGWLGSVSGQKIGGQLGSIAGDGGQSISTDNTRLLQPHPFVSVESCQRGRASLHRGRLLSDPDRVGVDADEPGDLLQPVLGLTDEIFVCDV
jgi:hypothetical protein